jgi:hypothetical protein
MDGKTIIGLEITLAVGCPNLCTHCPQKLLLSRYPKGTPRVFTLERLQQCLETVPTWIHLAWTGFGEPFMCPDATKIMLWAHDRGHIAAISTTLRGATHEDIDAIAGLPWKTTVLHVPDAEGLMSIPVDDDYVSRFEHAVNAWKGHADFIFGNYVTPHHRLLPIMLKSGIHIPRFGFHDRAGLISWLPHHQKVGEVPLCGKMFRGNLLPNGDLCLCCDDYGLRHVWGNLLTDDYMRVFKGDRFQKFLADLKDPNSGVLCRYCTDNSEQGWDMEHLPDEVKTHKAYGFGDLMDQFGYGTK